MTFLIMTFLLDCFSTSCVRYIDDDTMAVCRYDDAQRFWVAHDGCSNCTFESTIPRILKKHLNSIIQCSKCSEKFCGKRAKQQHVSHEKKHVIKQKEHVCIFCKIPFPYASYLERHQMNSVCGRKNRS